MRDQHVSVTGRSRARESLGQADPELLDVVDRRYDGVWPVDRSDFVYVNVAYKVGIGYLLGEYALDGIFTLDGLRQNQARALRAGMVRGSVSERALDRPMDVVEWYA